jgi:hypothetical protein
VAVIINETGRDHEPIGINGARRGVAEFADRDNFPIADCDITAESGHAGAIDHPTMFDDQIISHCQSSIQVPQPKALWYYSASAL